DPDVIHEFASSLPSQVHLEYLYILTVCDISATNPKLWNSWRASLLRQLYTETKRALRRRLDGTPHRNKCHRATQHGARDILHAQCIRDGQINRIWDTRDAGYFLRDSTGEIAWQTAAILRRGDSKKPLVLIHDAKGGAAE